MIKYSKNNHNLYKYYFLEISRITEIPLDYFKDPSVKKKKIFIVK